MKCPDRQAHGFTTIELIAVLVIIGIVSGVVVSRLTSPAAYGLKSKAEVLRGHLRYAQIRSMNSNMVWGIHFHSSTAYSLFRNGSTSDLVPLPGEDTSTVTLTGGIAVTTGIVSFDARGKPCTDAGAATAQNEAGGWRIITLTAGGSSENVRIRNNTGFVP